MDSALLIYKTGVDAVSLEQAQERAEVKVAEKKVLSGIDNKGTDVRYIDIV